MEIQIVNTNFNLIVDEQGRRQPIALFTALGINARKKHEQMFISKKRKINAEKEISRHLAFIRLNADVPCYN